LNASSAFTPLRLETSLKTELTLHLTQEMRQRLEILQANILSLEHMLQTELEQNPALEIVQDEPDEKKETELTETNEVTQETQEALKDTAVDDYYPDGDDSYPSPYTQAAEQDDRENIYSAAPDRSSLEEQMLNAITAEFSKSEEDFQIAKYILDLLDDDGFLHQTPEQIALYLGCEQNKVAEIRDKITRMEPVGIAAYDIREALIIQLNTMSYDDNSVEVRILKECFSELLQQRITSIGNKLRIPQKRIVEAFELIATLDPKPGRNFHEIPSRTVQPDISLIYRQNKLKVTINEGPIPPLRLSRRVREILDNPKIYKKEDIEFAKRKLESAKMFIKGILQRRETLSRLGEELLMRNYDFFSGRSSQIVSLLMKDIAEALSLHPSTISRAVKDKYIETPVGIFPLKSFFTKTEHNPLLTKVKTIIDAEDKSTPFTDAQISKKLQEMGIKLSRRTVAKYRMLLNIPDCFQRKALHRPHNTPITPS